MINPLFFYRADDSPSRINSTVEKHEIFIYLLAKHSPTKTIKSLQIKIMDSSSQKRASSGLPSDTSNHRTIES